MLTEEWQQGIHKVLSTPVDKLVNNIHQAEDLRG